MIVKERAPAKINLYLHVGGLRSDGLHDLASLFVFANTGDVITVQAPPPSSASKEIQLQITGPFAKELCAFDPKANLVMRAAVSLQAENPALPGCVITLEKNLPIAAGIGGGSADAAAALRALCKFWSISMASERLQRIAFALGADVPACLSGVPTLVLGAGEKMTPALTLPPLWITIINPGVATPTGPIFRAFDAANPVPRPPSIKSAKIMCYSELVRFMSATRNDLEPYAVRSRPVISQTLLFLKRQPGCFAARMSGSGASVFGLFSSFASAHRAANSAKSKGWWANAERLLTRNPPSTTLE